MWKWNENIYLLLIILTLRPMKTDHTHSTAEYSFIVVFVVSVKAILAHLRQIGKVIKVDKSTNSMIALRCTLNCSTGIQMKHDLYCTTDGLSVTRARVESFPSFVTRPWCLQSFTFSRNWITLSRKKNTWETAQKCVWRICSSVFKMGTNKLLLRWHRYTECRGDYFN